MDFKGLFKNIAHTALGAMATAVATIPAGASPHQILAVAATSAITSSISAAQDGTQANPLLHGILGFAPVAIIAALTGDHVTLIQTLQPALLSGLTSVISAMSPKASPIAPMIP